MYLKKYSWQAAGLAATLLLNGCAFLAPPGTGTEEDPYNENTREYAPNVGGTGATYPVPNDGYSSPNTTIGYPSNTGSYTPPATEVYTPPETTYYPPSGGSTNYHTVRAGENLYRISKSYGLRYQDVAALNNIPPPYTVSVGQRLLIRGSKGASAPSTTSTGKTTYHTVQAGENLYRISLKYGCTVADIARWNGLTASDYSNLKVGQKLRIATTAFTSNRSAVAPPSPILKTVPVTPPNTSSSAPMTVPNSNFHVVGANESLASIASAYGLTVYELALWNGISSPYTVYPGQRLLIVPP